MIPRRRILELFAGGAAGWSVGRAPAAAMLAATPRQTAGPFYPQSFPADADNDLPAYLGHWYANAPSEQRQFLASLLALLGVAPGTASPAAVAAGPAPRTAAAGQAGPAD